jgi:hypothetical protein
MQIIILICARRNPGSSVNETVNDLQATGGIQVASDYFPAVDAENHQNGGVNRITKT